ncbi:hypothetical protein A5712_21660 [Mycobacterium sp. E2327]|uniref:hypothetical protein n=1 Tax=Mycobacterium sp. E2327 TaxID=1834132 RepID=UPI000800B948|nr:hypothetical protein [Mycobacterium sp. E2327]OBI18598.1 hypothetical protein A5712_21660 [Mycobacterium sp. E2327]
MSEIATAPLGTTSLVIDDTALDEHDDGYTADASWQNNFERMARCAAHKGRFYAIAGSNVRRRADEIRAGWS